MTDCTPLFHGTLQLLKEGQTLTASTSVAYYQEVVTALETSRPEGFPSRDMCMFATDSLAGAAAFMISQRMGTSNVPRFYEVEMPIFHRAPFALIHKMSKRLKSGEPIEAEMHEYWTPAHDWRFWDYFGPSLMVIREVAAPPDHKVLEFKLQYDLDVERARGLGSMSER